MFVDMNRKPDPQDEKQAREDYERLHGGSWDTDLNPTVRAIWCESARQNRTGVVARPPQPRR